MNQRKFMSWTTRCLSLLSLKCHIFSLENGSLILSSLLTLNVTIKNLKDLTSERLLKHFSRYYCLIEIND